ncbi:MULTISPECIES: hypothetical protein [Prauserella salsuginis group]|uniref:Uncharacterized protein n=1 Tax=Prauserella salsuginis TaxID=387889 RepID=A0ABW6FYQ3_9PSEU|nr:MULTISPECIES: hypothetical protein [Prauserella salsuginis group]
MAGVDECADHVGGTGIHLELAESGLDGHGRRFVDRVRILEHVERVLCCLDVVRQRAVEELLQRVRGITVADVTAENAPRTG